MQSREKFLEVSQEFINKVPGAYAEAITIPTKTSAHLTTDTLYLPQQGKQTHLLIVTSGIHGVEAFTGAAIQMEFLTKNFKPEWLQKTGILIVHAVNPYGFHFQRRVDEDNVDLNRNMSADERLFERKSADYQSFEPFLNPTKPRSAGFMSDAFLFIKSLVKLFTVGRNKIAQISVGGQYQNPKGIYYGGQQNQPNSELIKKLFKKVGAPYSKVYHVDLHTGYGERGVLHFFSSSKVAQISGFENIFDGYKIDLASDKDFYETSGDFVRFSFETFADKELILPMTFEFGTMDSQTIMGGFLSLRNMIYENQGHHWGYSSPQAERTVKKDFMNMFNPEDQQWRDQVLKNGTETLVTTLERFSKI